jgi:thiosulfate/3-mercaptopyruvate sulfurtransferase
MTAATFQPDGPIVSAEWLRQNLNHPGVVVVDVRPHDAYRAGHIPGARHLDLSILRLSSSAPAVLHLWKERLQETIQRTGITGDQRVVFYEDYSGTMAATGVWLLDAAGLRNGSLLDGGFARWVREGGATSDDEVQPEESSTVIHPDDRVIATAGEILADLRTGGSTRFIDSRAPMEHRQGAIPGAANIDWTQHLDAEGAFRPLPELAELYVTAGMDKNDPVISYCAGGFRASHTYVTLKALGFDTIANYAPSWGEWGQRPDTPKERS